MVQKAYWTFCMRLYLKIYLVIGKVSLRPVSPCRVSVKRPKFGFSPASILAHTDTWYWCAVTIIWVFLLDNATWIRLPCIENRANTKVTCTLWIFIRGWEKYICSIFYSGLVNSDVCLYKQWCLLISWCPIIVKSYDLRWQSAPSPTKQIFLTVLLFWKVLATTTRIMLLRWHYFMLH